MSGVINLLPESLANQIAAGEVIQRPSSVVKELLENALDAAARKVNLIIKDSGKTLIQVVDDGVGMSSEDAEICFLRHATSKINKSDDLFQIQSFGFRGEALASIASIAQVELRTKRKEDELGTLILIEGGKILKRDSIQCAEGTSISVKNLFFNVPARRKFLKSDPVELKHIIEEFTRVALPNCEVFFSMHHNTNELYHFPISNLRQRISNLFGKATNEQIVPIDEETDVISISGYVGKPELIRKTRGDQYFFVNKRFIKSNYLNHAIKQAYENIIPVDYFPFYMISIDIDPAMIDVNIHPTKQEIKFENERLIYNYLKVAVKHALGRYSITPSIDFESTDPEILNRTIQSRRMELPNDFQIRSTTGVHLGDKKNEQDKWFEFYDNIKKDTSVDVQQPITLSSDWNSNDLDESTNATKCFQIHESFIISPIKSGWVVIDQSAAHERILYERHLKSLDQNLSTSQSTLFPETIQVDPQYTLLLESLTDQLNFVGVMLEKFGQNTFIVNGLPPSGLNLSTQNFVEHFLTSYLENQELEINPQENIARSMAFQMRIPKGKKLQDEEMSDLIDKLFACENPYNTPSGKKCFITFGLDEIEKRFRN